MLRNVVICGILLQVMVGQMLWARPDTETARTTRQCTLPANDERGIHYEGGGVEDSLAWGPSALTIAPDGRLIVADAARLRLVEYDAACSFQRVIDLTGKVSGISDVKVTDEGYFVLDAVSEEAAILHVDASARVLRTFRVPPSRAMELPSLVVEDGHRVLLGLYEGAMTIPLDEDGAELLAEPSRGLRDHGIGIVASAAQDGVQVPRGGSRNLSLEIGPRRVTITSAEPVKVFRVLGTAASRHIYARAVEVNVVSGALHVRESIYRIGFDGEVDGVAHGLFGDEHVFVANRLTVDPSRDRVLALYTYPDRADIHEIVFSRPDEILPQSLLPEEAQADDMADGWDGDSIFEAAGEARCKVFPPQIRRVANGYINNVTELDRGNIETGSCARREKPSYLNTPGPYRSVPYDWGGFDSVADFNKFMEQGLQAGDRSSDAVAACSKGVDCSGFVSRAWLLPAKKGTANLRGIAAVLSKQEDLRFGDVLNKDAHHVVLIDSVTPDAVNVYEATTDQRLDRVVRRATPWSRYANGYTRLRYNNYCERAAGEIGCVGRAPQLQVDVPVNLTGGGFTGRGQGRDYDGDPLYFKVIGDFNRKTRALTITLDFYQDAALVNHVRTDRCVGSLDKNDRFTDPQCELIQDTSANCGIFLNLDLQGESETVRPIVWAPSLSSQETIRE